MRYRPNLFVVAERPNDQEFLAAVGAMLDDLHPKQVVKFHRGQRVVALLEVEASGIASAVEAAAEAVKGYRIPGAEIVYVRLNGVTSVVRDGEVTPARMSSDPGDRLARPVAVATTRPAAGDGETLDAEAALAAAREAVDQALD